MKKVSKRGNMYQFVSHTWNAVKGKCEHGCAYCYMKKWQHSENPLTLDSKCLKKDLGNGNFIFVGSGTDLFASNVENQWILNVLNYCEQFDNKYLFQSKNPKRILDFIDHPVFKKSVVCTTIETNRNYPEIMCNAPKVEERVAAMETISNKGIKTYVTIEPVMDFDLEEFVDQIKRCNPEQVNIGANSRRTVELPEPSKDKILSLIEELSVFTTVEKKRNLNKLINTKTPMETEFASAKLQLATSISMKVQIMEKSENGYTFKEEYRKFGLVKENRPIKTSDVNGFLQIIQNGKYDETQSIVTVEASEIIGDYNVVDLQGNPISEADAHEYLIVLDGQHRITAFSKLNSIRENESQILIPNIHVKKGLENIREYLADINMVGHNWNMADKICVSAIATGNKLLDKINELIKEGYNASTAIQICIGRKISMKQLKEILCKGDTSCLPNEDEALKRAEKFIVTAMSIEDMTAKILTKRYFIKGFNSFARATSDDQAFEALKNLTLEDFKETREDDDFVEKLKSAA